MKFADLVSLSQKDDQENANVGELKDNYMTALANRDKAVKSKWRTLDSIFDNELQDLINSNFEITHEIKDENIVIKFGSGNISLELGPSGRLFDEYAIQKKLFMKRGDKTDFTFIELAPAFPYGTKISKDKKFVDAINKGTNLSIQEIQELKQEIERINKDIEMLSNSLPHKYYVFKTNKADCGKANQSEKLEEILDRAIAMSDIFNSVR